MPYLVINDPHYSADGYTGDRITLIDEGEILATAYAYEGTGRFTLTDAVMGDTILYRDWELALSEATGYGRDFIGMLSQQESFE
jgi:hypothetical protein